MISVDFLKTMSYPNVDIDFKTSRMTMEDLKQLPQRFSSKVGSRFNVNKELKAFAEKHEKSKKPFFYLVRKKSFAGKKIRAQMCKNNGKPVELLDVFLCRFSKDKKQIMILSTPIVNQIFEKETEICDSVVKNEASKIHYENLAKITRARMKNISPENMLKVILSF